MSHSTKKTGLAWRAWCHRVFGMDVRSLAMFRIFLALTVLVDVFSRYPDAGAFYSDAGVYDRETNYRFIEEFGGKGWEWCSWSWNWLSGSVGWQQTLFLIEAVAAVCLLVGFASRFSVFVIWMLVVSQHLRGPLVITSGDMLLKLMLFWSLFLPLDRVWSLAARRRPVAVQSPETWHVSIATAGFIIQVILMYFFTGVAKFNDIWFAGHAMDYVLRLELYITDFGRWMLNFPGALKVASWATLLIELLTIWFLLSPWRNSFWRVFNISAFWGFHLGIALCMSIGLFPLICMIAWLPLFPREAWTAEAVPQPSRKRLSEWQRLGLVAGGLVIATTLWVNLSNLGRGPFTGTLPAFLRAGIRAIGIEQHFQMFGIPPNESPWFVYEARLKNGNKVDLFREGNSLELEKPADIAATFPGHNWRKLHQNLVDRRLEAYRPALLEYAVRQWNASHSEGEQIQSATLRCFIERTGPDYNPIERWSTVWGTYQDPRSGAGSLFDELDRQLEEGKSGLPY
ncbi:MAG: HTTM domain-containing protein [Planctomycetota bacterium]